MTALTDGPASAAVVGHAWHETCTRQGGPPS